MHEQISQVRNDYKIFFHNDKRRGDTIIVIVAAMYMCVYMEQVGKRLLSKLKIPFLCMLD